MRFWGLHQVELAEADAETLPLEDASADLFLSYFGLHCFPHPDAAVREAARCLRDGGTQADLERWLSDAGVADVEIERSGVFAVFRGGRPAAQPSRL